MNDEGGGGKSNVQESFVLAEVIKYIYLTHLEVSFHQLCTCSKVWDLS